MQTQNLFFCMFDIMPHCIQFSQASCTLSVFSPVHEITVFWCRWRAQTHHPAPMLAACKSLGEAAVRVSGTNAHGSMSPGTNAWNPRSLSNRSAFASCRTGYCRQLNDPQHADDAHRINHKHPHSL